MRSIPIRGLALELLRDLAQTSSSLGYIFPNKTLFQLNWAQKQLFTKTCGT